MAQTALILIVLTIVGLLYADRWLKSAHEGGKAPRGASKRSGQTKQPPLLNGQIYIALLVVALVLAFLWR